MPIDRRSFVGFSLGAAGEAALGAGQIAEQAGPHPAVDFRYSPLSWQTAFCFPDDPFKSLVGERGELRYGHPGLPAKGRVKPNDYFPLVVEFSLLGMEPNVVGRQQLEAPAVPIVHTRIDRPEAFMELTTFATNRAGEGRVDNVILEVRPVAGERVRALPLVIIKTRPAVAIDEKLGTATLVDDKRLLLACAGRLYLRSDNGLGYVVGTRGGWAAVDKPLRFFFRLPQEGQELAKIEAGLKIPDELLAEVREYWQNWRPFAAPVSWSVPRPYGDFLTATTRNIQQAREVKEGRSIFQVGPTIYRGLWVTDGNHLLEAARFLGYDKEAQQSLEAIWARQEADGGIFAGAGRSHWKDTGIAMFILVRQAELSQDWSYFRQMQPNVLRAVKFLMALREKAKAEDSANGRYGLLPRGFPDGGLWGVRSEFANTIGVLPGLKAITETADRMNLAGFEFVKQFYQELRASFYAAARAETRRHPAGFEYLPMLMKDDPQWSAPDPWDRPQPQGAQWALANAIFPGYAFEKDDWIVKGYLALMQAATREGVPAETGFLKNGGLWTYEAPFAAHVYLWAGLTEWARQTFIGYLNHASPLYCWREEQPLRGSMVAEYFGDMPHNQASAWCILYLRNMLAMEDGPTLRLLPGIGDLELQPREPYTLAGSPTRFGRIGLKLEPLGLRQGWRLEFTRGAGPAPAAMELPAALGTRLRFAELKGAATTARDGVIRVSPEARSWAATWRTS